MNREILFRGMTKDGKWVEGDLVHGCRDAFNDYHDVGIQISGHYPTPVLPETVGQYTGLKDKNVVRIFEGDKYLAFGKDEPDEVVFWDGAFGYNSGRFGFIAFVFNPNFMWYNNTCEKIEVIGNIHEQELK